MKKLLLLLLLPLLFSCNKETETYFRVENLEYFDIVFVENPCIDGVPLSSGESTIKLKNGTHVLTWKSSYKNGFGTDMEIKSHRKEIVVGQQMFKYNLICGRKFYNHYSKGSIDRKYERLNKGMMDYD